ncbi:MAG: Crp/Fnr family transcriptional regulator [Clostridiales bacterium]|nr:Crp/Fnr family transcriptional regulator [Clostridiales bacterium]
MEIYTLFDGVAPQERKRMMDCFQPVSKRFKAGETVMSFAGAMQKIGVMMAGRAHLSCVDENGRESRLEQLSKNDVFGDMFTLPLERLSYFVTAETACEVLFIDYVHVVKRCERACAYHSQLVHNLFQMVARKSQAQTMHVSVLSQRTVRQKLMTYFELLCRHTSGRLPMSYSALAAYLSIDRSAMMREIGKMKDEGLVRIEGREVILP